MTIKVLKDNLKTFMSKLKEMESKNILVGIPADAAPREEKTEITNAEIGYVNEFGSPAKNIPPRPFLMPGVKDAGDQVSSVLGKCAVNKDADINSQLDKAGLLAQSAVRRRITLSIGMRGISEETRKRREAKGRTGEMKPLIDTGQLINSITYVIEEK